MQERGDVEIVLANGTKVGMTWIEVELKLEKKLNVKVSSQYCVFVIHLYDCMILLTCY